jgi:hypothetical protein
MNTQDVINNKTYQYNEMWTKAEKLQYLSLIFKWLIDHAGTQEVRRIVMDLMQLPVMIEFPVVMGFNEDVENIKEYLQFFFEKLSNTHNAAHINGVCRNLIHLEDKI